jgi:hypothetical protein
MPGVVLAGTTTVRCAVPRRKPMRTDVSPGRKLTYEDFVKFPVVRIYRRVNDSLARVQELDNNHGATLESPVLPGLRLPLDRIFAR